jgi:CDP-glucose 4,6-dehydratase
LEDLGVLVRVLNEYEIDSVFHLCAQTVVGAAARSPLSTFEANIRGTWNLLEAVRLCPRLVERVVVASSDKAYGCHDHLPYREDAPLQGRFPYDVSKSCADLITFSYFATYRTPVAVTRCGNLFGPGDLNFNRLIPGTIRSLLRGERPIVRSDGKFIRDYFYVRDAAQAYLQLAERLPAEGFVGEAFNFGTELPLAVVDVVDRLLHLMNRTDLEPVILNQASHEIPKQYLDCTKARALLGWRPLHAFEEGLQQTIAWYKQWLAKSGQRVAMLTHAP